jgi:hypothetical protein
MPKKVISSEKRQFNRSAAKARHYNRMLRALQAYVDEFHLKIDLNNPHSHDVMQAARIERGFYHAAKIIYKEEVGFYRFWVGIVIGGGLSFGVNRTGERWKEFDQLNVCPIDANSDVVQPFANCTEDGHLDYYTLVRVLEKLQEEARHMELEAHFKISGLLMSVVR